MSIRLSAADARRLKLPAPIARAVKKIAASERLGGFLTWRKRPILQNLKLTPEAKVQLQIMDYLRVHLRSDAVAYHPPNEAQRSKVWWALLYALGFWRGMVDIMILCQGRAYFIEVKSDSGKLTPEQEDFMKWATASGFPCILARDLGDASAFLTANDLRAT
jgi:hypothetical protein